MRVKRLLTDKFYTFYPIQGFFSKCFTENEKQKCMKNTEMRTF